jgi:hypothetical protein
MNGLASNETVQVTLSMIRWAPRQSDKTGEFAADLASHFTPICAAVGQRGQQRMADAFVRSDMAEPLRALPECLDMMRRLDAAHGVEAQLPDGAQELLGRTLDLAAQLAGALQRLDLPLLAAPLMQGIVGIGCWGRNHGLPSARPELIAHALAVVANAGDGRAASSAHCALMQAFADDLVAELGKDEERSNPQRPWRILHLNLALTAIRSEDLQVMGAAFARMRDRLPAEAPAFFAEMLQLADRVGLPEPTRAMLTRFAQAHH